MSKYVLYNTTKNCYGYYCGSYIFQGSRYGAFSSRLDRAPGLKVYSSYKRAESARLKIYFENASPSDIIIKELA